MKWRVKGLTIKKLVKLTPLIIILLYLYGYLLLGLVHPYNFFLEKQFHDEVDQIIPVPEDAEINCDKKFGGPAPDLFEMLLYSNLKLKRYHFQYVCNLGWEDGRKTYSAEGYTGRNLNSHHLKETKIKVDNAFLFIQFDQSYLLKLCELPALKNIDEFLRTNTNLDVEKGKKYVEMPRVTLRDKDENVIAIKWDDYYDVNVDGIVDVFFPFNPGYNNYKSFISLMYSRTPNRENVKYSTIHSGETSIEYVFDDLFVRINKEGDMEIDKRPSYMHDYTKGECERYYLNNITRTYGIPCDDDWQCRQSYTTHAGVCVDPPEGVCVYPIVCRYINARSPLDYTEESYCMGACKYNRPIICEKLFRLTADVDGNKTLEYYNLGLLTG